MVSPLEIKLQPDEESQDKVMTTRKRDLKAISKQATVRKAPSRWTEEEHEKFVRAVEKHGKNWRKVTEIVQSKTQRQVRDHSKRFACKLRANPT